MTGRISQLGEKDGRLTIFDFFYGHRGNTDRVFVEVCPGEFQVRSPRFRHLGRYQRCKDALVNPTTQLGRRRACLRASIHGLAESPNVPRHRPECWAPCEKCIKSAIAHHTDEGHADQRPTVSPSQAGIELPIYV